MGDAQDYLRFEVIGSVEHCEAPLLVHVPHAARHIPVETRPSLLLSDAELEIEQSRVTDHLTDQLFGPAARGGVCFVNRISRLVFDPERFRSDEDEVMASRGVGAVYLGTSDGRSLRSPACSREERESILRTFYDPYASAVTDIVNALLARFGRCMIVDGHSYPSQPFSWELRALAPRPEVDLGTDAFHTPPELVSDLEALLKGRGVSFAKDVPFAGSYVPLEHLNKDRRVASVMLELRRDTYCYEHSGERTEGFDEVAALVGGLVEMAVNR